MQALSQQQQLSDNNTDNVWLWCEPLIKKCIKYQDMYIIDDIKELIEKGQFQLFPHNNQQSCFITELVVYPRTKALNLIFCAGRFEDLAEMLPSIERWGKYLGAEKLYGGGRKGWIKKTSKLGFKPEFIISKNI